MDEQTRRCAARLIRWGAAAAAAAAVWFCFRFLLPVLWPPVLAYLLSCIIVRPVDALCRQTPISRSAAAAVLTLLMTAAAALLLWGVSGMLAAAADALAAELPEMLSGIAAMLTRAEQRLDALSAKLPAVLRGGRLSLSSLIGRISLPQADFGGMLDLLRGAASSVPTVLLTVIFVLMAAFFLTAQRASVVGFFERQFPQDVLSAVRRLKSFLSGSVRKWLRAQALLIAITFCELTVGFLVMRQPHALPVAAVIAVVDALPVFGAGTALLPWSAYDLLTGSYHHAIGLLLIYGVVLIVRNAAEPHIVGEQLGLHPFVTLLCLYFGYRLAGFAGMLLFPAAALCLIKLREWGYLKLWR